MGSGCDDGAVASDGGRLSPPPLSLDSSLSSARWSMEQAGGAGAEQGPRVSGPALSPAGSLYGWLPLELFVLRSAPNAQLSASHSLTPTVAGAQQTLGWLG